jgi:hypothetical protein
MQDLHTDVMTDTKTERDQKGYLSKLNFCQEFVKRERSYFVKQYCRSHYQHSLQE